MRFLYTIGIYCYGGLIRIVSLFNTKAKDWVNGRRGWKQQLPELRGQEVIWFHCASLGEFDQGLPLMHRIKTERPDIFLLVTFFSPSGMHFHHKRNHPADHVMYMPLDTPGNAHRFIEHFQPSLAFFVKYEFWSNHILEARKKGTRLFNVSGLFREDHRFFRWYGSFFRTTLKQFEWFFVQNENSAALLRGIGIEQVSVSGDSRFDRVIENRKQVTENPIIRDFADGNPLLIAGSTWPEDEQMLAAWINAHDRKILIAPHAIDENHLRQIMSLFPEAVRYTASDGEDLSGKKILILDTIGQLANAYSYGSIAYVGGGFSGSLHNILEPAVFGLPVIFGPKHRRFPEAQQFIERGIGWSVGTADQFTKAMTEIEKSRESISRKTVQFVEENQGAADRIWQHINSN